MADSTLPVLTDEQIDEVWERMHHEPGLHGSDNRGSNRWMGLRAAFPTPPPSPPDGRFFIVDGDGWIVSKRIDIRSDEAGAALAELQACVKWIEEAGGRRG